MHNDVRRYGSLIQVSQELVEDSWSLGDAFRNWMAASPEQHAAWEREARAKRAAERAAEAVPLTLDALLDKLGFSRPYAEHLVQPYCTCGDTSDGWERCKHAEDLGLNA